MARPLASTAARPPRRMIAAVLAATAALALAVRAGAQNFPFDIHAQTIVVTAPIEDYVAKAAAEMTSGDRDRVMAGRQTLLAPLARDASQKSPAFLNAYARELNTGLAAVVDGKDPHAKLNAALVVIRAGEQSRAPALAPIISRLIADESPAVSSYGERAAGTVLVYALGNLAVAKSDPMLPAIVKAVTDNPESDAVVWEAYQALTNILSNRDLSQQAGEVNVANATPPIIDGLHQLMDVRLKQYAAGDIVEPAAELSGVTLLCQQKWDVSSPEQRTRTVQLTAALVDAAATQLVAAQSAGAVQNRARAKSLREAVKGAASGLGVVGQKAPVNRSVSEAANAIKNLGEATPAADYRAAADKLIAEARKAYPNEGGGSATAPATTAKPVVAPIAP